MGVCFSCCRRRRTPEREPLLPTTGPPDPLPPPHSQLDKAVDILGALNAGKLPSQSQANHFLQQLLRSEFLHDDVRHVISGYGPLSERGRRVVVDFREIVEALVQIGTEKNSDDILQDLLFESSKIDPTPVIIDADIAVDISKEGFSEIQQRAATPPSAQELTNDAENLVQSVKSLLRLLITSSAFRLILSDFLLATREMIAEVASEVGNVALQVQVAAEDVQNAARLDDLTLEGLKGKAKEAAAEVELAAASAKGQVGTLGDESADRAKDAVIGRVQEVIVQAHQNPKYKSALRTILLILRKYAKKLSVSAAAVSDTPQLAGSPSITIAPIIQVDENLRQALTDLRVLLERAASGQSLDPLLRVLMTTITDVVHAPSEAGSDLKGYFSSLGVWLDRALAQPQYITSRSGTRAAEKLYDTGRILLASESNSQWAHDVRTLIDRSNIFVSALATDPATNRLFHAIDTLSSDVLKLGRDTATSGVRAQRKWREEVVKDLIGWLVPRVLRSLHTLPMPRVEFQNNTLGLAVDALLLTSASASASLMPDHVWLQNWSEVRVNMVELDDASNPGVQTSARMRLHMDGIRVSAHGIGYYFKYKGLLAYSDEGLLSIDVGGPLSAGQGLSVDIELETSAESRRTDGEPLFRVLDVRVDIPGLTFSIDRSKHWVLNKVVFQPLSGPVVRAALGSVLERQIRRGVEALERGMAGISVEAGRRGVRRDLGGPSLEDYWLAFLEKAPSLFSQAPEEDTPASEESATTETHTTATLKGIIHTSITQQDGGLSRPATPEETVIAVGGGAQLFPDKGGLVGVGEETPGEVAREAVDEVRGAVGRAAGKTREVVGGVANGAVRAREAIERAEERKGDRERVESMRRGWRSRAFDF